MAEGIAKSSRFELVASTVAYDSRNDDLIGCMKSTGIDNFTTSWEQLFIDKALFKTWSHQEWVELVRLNDTEGTFKDWVKYMEKRYEY